jgi:hypothetical protein
LKKLDDDDEEEEDHYDDDVDINGAWKSMRI